MYGPRVSSSPGSPSGTGSSSGPTMQDLVGGRQRAALRPDHDVVGVVEPGVVEEPFGHPEDLLHRAADGRADPAGDLGHEAGAADLEHLEAGEVRGRLVPRSKASSQRIASAGTSAVIVTRSASTTAMASSGLGDGAMTTRPPTARVPIRPGQPSGKLWAAGSATR